MMEEMIDLYDGERNKTGECVPRKTKLVPGRYMLYVIAIVMNEEGRILVTRRSLDKKWAAGCWEIPGGGALAGESSFEAVQREVREETGLTIRKDEARVVYSYRNDDAGGDNYFTDIYLCRLPFAPADVTVQEKEVLEFRLVLPEEIGALREVDGFLHYERLMTALAAADEQ